MKMSNNLWLIKRNIFKILWVIFLYLAPTRMAIKYAVRSHQPNYCVGQELGEFVANPNDCKLFYWCRENGEASIAACPANMLFNSQTKLCDSPQNAQCEGKTMKPSNISTGDSLFTTTITVEQDCYNFYNTQRNSNALAFAPHPRHCELYYMCYRGHVLLQTCSPKLHWNSKLSKCVLPSRAECFGVDVEESKEENTEGLPLLDHPIWSNGIKCPLYGQHIFPNIKRCDSFIYCIKGHAVLQFCPFYQFFDVESTRCKWLPKAKCIKDINLAYRKRSFW